MSRTILILAAVILIAFTLVSLVAYRAASRAAEKMKVEGAKVLERGKRYGRTRTSEECLQRALTMLRDRDGVVGHVRARLFLSGCLDTATVTEGFCEDVPGEDSPGQAGLWIVRRCEELGVPADPCSRVLPAVVEYCDREQ